ncbi:MAG: hypothetical protein K6F86_12810 [Lachnospiraceae bacterium]|nr:hypothetical protein [Lachnospiraceae bacterium]
MKTAISYKRALDMEDMQETLERILRSYSQYYRINRETPADPFLAEATFDMHGEEYFLIKSAKISEVDSREFVFFAGTDLLDEKKLAGFDERAWTEGMKRVEAKANHRNSDVVLIILAERFAEGIDRAVKKTKHYKSYLWGIHGWSNYRLVAYELSSGRTVNNRLGSDLTKLFAKPH